MKCVLRNRKFSATAPIAYDPREGELWEAVNEDTGEETLVVVKKDGSHEEGCCGCIANFDRWNASTCKHISCGRHYFKLIDINDIIENL